MKCPNCGNENKENTWFCDACGQLLRPIAPIGIVPKKIGSKSIQPAASDTGGEGDDSPAAKAAVKKSANTKPVLVAVIVILIIGMISTGMAAYSSWQMPKEVTAAKAEVESESDNSASEDESQQSESSNSNTEQGDSAPSVDAEASQELAGTKITKNDAETGFAAYRVVSDCSGDQCDLFPVDFVYASKCGQQYTDGATLSVSPWVRVGPDDWRASYLIARVNQGTGDSSWDPVMQCVADKVQMPTDVQQEIRAVKASGTTSSANNQIEWTTSNGTRMSVAWGADTVGVLDIVVLVNPQETEPAVYAMAEN